MGLTAGERVAAVERRRRLIGRVGMVQGPTLDGPGSIDLQGRFTAADLRALADAMEPRAPATLEPDTAQPVYGIGHGSPAPADVDYPRFASAAQVAYEAIIEAFFARVAPKPDPAEAAWVKQPQEVRDDWIAAVRAAAPILAASPAAAEHKRVHYIVRFRSPASGKRWADTFTDRAVADGFYDALAFAGASPVLLAAHSLGRNVEVDGVMIPHGVNTQLRPRPAPPEEVTGIEVRKPE